MASPYDNIIEMIKKLDLQDDGIKMNHKIRSIEQDFCNIVRNENMLSESMDYINNKVLSDNDAALKFALLFSSRNFDSLAMNDTKVRSKMLNILQNNYANAEQYRKDDKNRLYNSITLLGEYYHRVRLADGSPISILGESLLGLLTAEMCSGQQDGEPIQTIDLKLAKLILSQVTLNGSIMRATHKEELSILLYHVRRNLIEQPNLKAGVKALLLMTLDLYYSNFSNLGHMLEEMYTKYLVEEETLLNQEECLTLENGNGTFEDKPPVTTKTWSEQVCEDSLYETENNDEFCDNSIVNEDNITHHEPQLHLQQSDNPVSDKSFERTRLNNNNRQNRNSANYEDDRHSVRSEGGSIRLYSVNDRLRNTQNRNNGNNNRDNNWERNTYRNNRRSNSRNRNQYDNNPNNGNYHNQNNRNYDRPPRFRTNENLRNNEQFKNNDSWRNNGPQGAEGNFVRGGSRGPDSRSSSITRTLPRPHRNNNFEHYNGGPKGNQSVDGEQKDSYNKGNFGRNGQRQQSRNFSRSNRYGSQSSLASDSGTWERPRNRRNSRGKSQDWDDTRSLHGQPEENNWETKDNNSELVKNARNTTKYMEYLSQK